ncbi:hypothetical protein Q4574_15880 [Aliiglaciecola sp. 3_MG-2023]|nr:hypothetical protein [Aliiglaciecola sp. 3_MG-2023]MDO6694777.1 hypothetical protein [Aliiglaciecola sp. 3_MG-2023]
MQTLIKNVKSIFHSKSVNKSSTHCNYANNYYGDQLCGAKNDDEKSVN